MSVIRSKKALKDIFRIDEIILKFKQVSEHIPIQNKDNFFRQLLRATVFAVFFYIILRQFELSKKLILPIILLSVFLWRRSRRILSDWVGAGDEVGEVEFGKNITRFDGLEIRDGDLKSIYFRYDYIKGRNYAPKNIIHNGLAELNLTTKSDEVVRVKFIIETEEQFDYLKEVFKKWYQHGVAVEEEFSNLKIKTIGLDVVVHKSYAEIQEIKRVLRR